MQHDLAGLVAHERAVRRDDRLARVELLVAEVDDGGTQGMHGRDGDRQLGLDGMGDRVCRVEVERYRAGVEVVGCDRAVEVKRTGPRRD